MGIFFAYILKSAICLAAFYLFYKWLLSRETFHRFNRLALLGIIALSVILPLIKVATNHPTVFSQTLLTMEDLLAMAQATVGEESTLPASQAGWQEVAIWTYTAGVLFFFIKNLIALRSMRVLIRRSRKEELGGGIRLVVHQEKLSPFSWMNYIVISEKDLDENAPAVLAHEQAHIRFRHSWDMLLAEACIWLQWFNPAAWLLKRELQTVHEFEADSEVLKSGIQAKDYQLLLIKKAVGSRLYSLANSFNHSSLKKRITMMMRKKSNPWACAKYAYVLPLAAVAVAAFARPEISQPLQEISRAKVTTFPAISDAGTSESFPNKAKSDSTLQLKGDVIRIHSSKQSDDKEPYTMVDQMPQFPGGATAMLEYIQANLRYPEDAKKPGLEGRVIARFVVGADGSVSDVTILRAGLTESMNAEVIRVLKSMPKWEPGMQDGKAVPVYYTCPVVFKMRHDESTSVERAPEPKAVPVPLILVDGEEYAGELNQIDPSTIESITVLKDPASIEKYGDKGKNGVILITLKK